MFPLISARLIQAIAIHYSSKCLGIIQELLLRHRPLAVRPNFWRSFHTTRVAWYANCTFVEVHNNVHMNSNEMVLVNYNDSWRIGIVGHHVVCFKDLRLGEGVLHWLMTSFRVANSCQWRVLSRTVQELCLDAESFVMSIRPNYRDNLDGCVETKLALPHVFYIEMFTSEHPFYQPWRQSVNRPWWSDRRIFCIRIIRFFVTNDHRRLKRKVRWPRTSVIDSAAESLFSWRQHWPLTHACLNCYYYVTMRHRFQDAFNEETHAIEHHPKNALDSYSVNISIENKMSDWLYWGHD